VYEDKANLTLVFFQNFWCS